jgi:hypothetical protein
VITFLRRAHAGAAPESAVHAELASEITRLERLYFGPGGNAEAARAGAESEELVRVLGKWSSNGRPGSH